MKRELLMSVGPAAALLTGVQRVTAQSKLYPRLFDLQEVVLEESVFKTAMDLNDKLLLEYDVDRLLTPYFRQAGITSWESRHPNFQNWGSGNFRLDGHVGGHYLTALALAYAASQDEDMRVRMKERMDYMVDKMAECQARFDSNTEGLYGYIGGLPDNQVWTDMYARNLSRFNSNRGNVPFYTMHKVYAGLREAYVYGRNEKALACFLKLCDWGVNLISNLTDAEVQNILDTEHGGINEVYADAYRLTGDEKYLVAARRYSHQTMVTNMQTVNSSFLNNKHANTQVPKYIGFARVAQEDGGKTSGVTETYLKAARNFWTEVTDHRTVAIGGNSVAEHFLPANRSGDYITNPDGPESCNTNNMLKLTEDLFGEDPSVKYADFYEYATINHILSTQNPHTGGYVYFTSLRPQHYRMYSQVNQGMWCCVGTGMENHGKYGEFVYAHSPANDTLYVNLFMASRLKNDVFALTQETRFPYEERTVLTLDKSGTYTMAVRRPSWCTAGFRILIDGVEQNVKSAPGEFVALSRSWKAGEKVTVEIPMHLDMVECPNYPSYVALRYGPMLLGAKTSEENLAGQFAGEGRMDHCPSHGAQLSLTSAPMLIGERAGVLDSVYVVDKEKLHFKIRKGLYSSERFADLLLQPFFTIHEARYMIYWNQMSEAEWEKIKGAVMAEEAVKQRLNERTLDFVSTGEQQSDAGHVLQGDFEKGAYAGEFFVDAKQGKWFSYMLCTQGVSENVALMCRYHSADAGRTYTISVNGKELRKVTLPKRQAAGFYNVEYPVPTEMLCDESGVLVDSVLVRFEATGSTPTPGLYSLRLLKEYSETPVYAFNAAHWIMGDAARVDKVEYPEGTNTIKVYGKRGNNNIALQYATYLDEASNLLSHRKYFAVRGSSLKTGDGMAYMWWFNGANHGSQVAPTYSCGLDNGETLFVWDIMKSGLDDNFKTDTVAFSSWGKALNTVFGLTSAAADGTAVISDISFYSTSELVARYTELRDLIGMNVLDELSEKYSPVYDYKTFILAKRFKAGEWTGLCVPFSMSWTKAHEWFSEWKELDGLMKGDDGVLTLFFKNATRVQAGQIYLASSLKDIEEIENTGTLRSDVEPLQLNEDGVTVCGTFAAVSDIGTDVFCLESGSFSANTENRMVKGYNLYLRLAPEEVGNYHTVLISFDAKPDGITSSTVGKERVDVYGLDGVKLKTSVRRCEALRNLSHGIYIINGTKIVR